MSALPASSLPPLSAATEPASVRNGPPAAKQAYQEALGFEQLLVDQLSQQLAASTSMMGSDPGTSAFASLIPQALTSGIMSAGGTGIALQLATALDPALGEPTARQAAKP